MRILAIGDIVGSRAVEYIREKLPSYIKNNNIDFVVANGENANEIRGISSNDADTLFASGVDFITLGNHAFGRKDIYNYLDSHANIIRPANFAPNSPGNGYNIININGYKFLCINVLGVVYMNPLNSPFEAIERILDREEGKYDFALLDVHGEATSEKMAIAYSFDGKISIIFGTHTHIQTNDARILPNGTGYITDLGMTGPINSILGTKIDCIIDKFRTQLPVRFEVADGVIEAQGAIFELNTDNKKITSVQSVKF